MKYTGYSLIGVVICLAVWGFIIEPRLIDTTEEAAVIPGLPGEWEGQLIAVIADYQVGMWGANVGTARRMIRQVVEQRPAAVLLAGDFVYKTAADSSEHLETVIEIVSPLTSAGIPTFAVLGNHDYSLDVEDDTRNDQLARAVEDALKRAGVRVLENEAVALRRTGERAGGQPLYLVGIGSEWGGRANSMVSARSTRSGRRRSPRLRLMASPTSSRSPSTTIPPRVR